MRGTSLERALRVLLPGAAFALSFGAGGKPNSIIFLPSPALDATPSDASDGIAPPMDDPAAAE